MSKLIKKKRKRNLIISLIVLTVLLTLGGMTTALGSTSVGDNIGIAPPSYVYGWPTSQPCRKSCTYSTHWGLRLALVDKNGKRVSGTRILDLWGSAFLNASGTKHRNYITVVEGRDVNLSSAAYFGANLRQEALKTDQYGLQVTKGPYWTSSSTVKASFLEFAQYAQKSAPGLATALRTVDGSLGTGSGADITVTPKWFDYVADIAEAQDKNKETDDGPGNLLYEILVKLGYKGTGDGSRRVHDAAREGYFLQAEPLMTYARIGGQIRRMYWFTGTLTEAMMFDIAANGKVGGPCGGFWHGYCDGVPKTPGLYIVDGKDRPSCFIEGDNYFDNFSAWEMLGPITTGIRGEGVAHIYFGQFNDGVDCETAVKWIHAHPDQYGAPNSDTYNAAIAKIVDGTFTYIDNTGATSTEMTIDGKYPTSTYVFLNPTNYMQRVDDPPTSEKKASCEIPEKLICDQVVSYINKWSGLVKDTDEYHNAIDRVEAGTYFYYGSPGGDGINKHYYMIDGPYDRMYLKKEKYTDPDSPYDGYASCAEPGKLSCEQAVAIINGETPSGLTGFEFNSGVSFPLNSQAYHDAVAQVVAGNFKYTDGKNRAWEIDTGYSFNMLDPTYYVLSQFGGKAACEDIPVPCGEPAEVEIDKTCETGLNYYKDSAQEKYWLVCESAYLKGNDPLTGIPYSSDNTGHDAVEEANDGIVGNKDYCELFCTETVETEFPTSVSNVKAGQVFGWGLPGRGDNGTFGYVRITKHCSNQKYDEAKGEGYQYKKWNNDYYNNEHSLISNFLAAEVRQWSNNTVTSQSYSGSCGCCGSHTVNGHTVCISCTKYKGIRTGYTKTYGGDSWMTSVTESSTDKTLSGYCSSSAAKAAVKYTDISTYKSAYLSAKAKEPELLKKIRQCTQNIQYVFKTTVTLQFEEPLNGAMADPNTRHFTYNDLLNLDPEEDGNYKTGYNTDNVNKSTCTEKTVYSYNCTGSGQGAKCTKVTQKVLDCKQVTWDIEGEWAFVYPEEQFTWFSLKTDSTMMNKENKPSGIDDAYFYSIGFGLPTAFSLPSGVYNLSASVSNLGDNAEMKEGQDYNTTDGHFAPLLEVNKAGKLGFDYDGCTYEVDNDIFGYDCRYDDNGRLIYDSPIYCDPTKNDDPHGDLSGLDLEYRLVSLIDMDDDINKAFPGQGGSGRNRGSNWRSRINDGTLDDDIREILQDGVYDSMAMYEIMLDVNAIQYIRRSNSEYFQAGVDPYTSYYDSSNSTLKILCKDLGYDRYCGSEFLTELNTSGALNYPLMGSCLPDGMSTEERVDFVLANGCSAVDSEVPEIAKYNYPTWNWVR